MGIGALLTVVALGANPGAPRDVTGHVERVERGFRLELDVPPDQVLGLYVEGLRTPTQVIADGVPLASHGDPATGEAPLLLPFDVDVPLEQVADGRVAIELVTTPGARAPREVMVGYPHAVMWRTLTAKQRRWLDPRGVPSLSLGLFLAAVGLLQGRLSIRRGRIEPAWRALVIGLLGVGLARFGWVYMGQGPPGFFLSRLDAPLGPPVTDPIVVRAGVAGALVSTLALTLTLSSRFVASLETLDRTLRASARFVPRQLLHLLGRDQITEVQRGDGTELDAAIVFVDIRGFTTLSEARTPERNFRFINAFLAAMEPRVTEHGGLLATNLGDGFMALFPEGRSDAVACAVAMQRELVAFNADQERAGEPRVSMGVGIHRGRVLVGTIGGETRLDTGVLSEAVEVAASVEGLSKTYGAPVLISGDQLERSPEWAVIERDRVDLDGTLVTVHEVVDGDVADGDAKRRDAAAWDAALDAFRAGDLATARAGFEALDGAAAALFVDRCRWLADNGLPEPWDGVMRAGVR